MENPDAFRMGPPGNPKTPLPGPESQQSMPTELRERQERAGGLPVEGQDLIDELRSVEVGENGDIHELKEAVDEALAFREGLELGIEGIAYEFDPEDTKDPYGKQKIAYLEKMFTTVESAISRPAPTYIDMALDEAINGRIRRAQDWHNKPDKYLRRMLSEYHQINRALVRRKETPISEEDIKESIEEKTQMLEREYQTIPALVELSNYVHSRRIFDTAFSHRMQTCEDPKRAAGLGGEIATVTPDGPHWMGYFQGKETGEFGDKVNVVLEEIVKFGLPEEVVRRIGMAPIPTEIRKLVPESIYADGFKSGVIFGVWVNHLLTAAEGRMDIVWNAWKMALTTEVIDTLGVTIDKEKGTYSLATAPLGNSLFTFINHLPEKRATEYGLKADGTRNPKQTEIFISHSGLPMTLGKITNKDGYEVPIFPSLCSDYFHESKIELDRQGMEANVDTFHRLFNNIPKKGDPDFRPSYEKLRKDLETCWNQTREDGKLKVKSVKISLWDLWLYGRMSLSDPNFPWFQTDQPDSAAAANELTPGSVGGWFLNRGRANGLVEDLKSQPTLNDLGDPLFFIKRVRNWSKLLGSIEKDAKPEENPRNWWIMGILQLHGGKAGEKSAIVQKDKTRDFRLVNRREEIERGGGTGISTGITREDVLESAVRCGFIRQVDKEWIQKNLV